MNARPHLAPIVDGLAAWVAPGRTSVVVIDMQVDFAAPEGALGQAGVDLSSIPPALRAAERLVRAARRAGALVAFVGLETSPERDSAAALERIRRRGGDPEAERALCRAGSAGAVFYGPQPRPGDLIVHKPRYSGFFGADLHDRLIAAGRDTLIVCGLTTECCVEATARDAFHLDHHVFVAADACAAYDPDLHAAALRAMELNVALLTDTAAIARAWRR